MANEDDDILAQRAARHKRMAEEEGWHRIAAVLMTVREMREVVVTSILMNGDPSGLLFERLQAIGNLEGRLLRQAHRKDRYRFFDTLSLDHVKSWMGIESWVRESGDYRLAAELGEFVPLARKLIEDNFRLDTDDD